MKQLFVVAVALMLMGGTAVAQDGDGLPNDPRVNENANACYAGGSLEGKCALDGDGNGIVDDYEADWAWNCGWHLIRLEAGIIDESDMPLSCAGVGRPLPCYMTQPGLMLSFQYVGPPNAEANVVIYGSDNCTGENIQLAGISMIHADLAADAEAYCNALNSVEAIVVNMNAAELGFAWPDNAWLCVDLALFELIF